MIVLGLYKNINFELKIIKQEQLNPIKDIGKKRYLCMKLSVKTYGQRILNR